MLARTTWTSWARCRLSGAECGGGEGGFSWVFALLGSLKHVWLLQDMYVSSATAAHGNPYVLNAAGDDELLPCFSLFEVPESEVVHMYSGQPASLPSDSAALADRYASDSLVEAGYIPEQYLTDNSYFQVDVK